MYVHCPLWWLPALDLSRRPSSRSAAKHYQEAVDAYTAAIDANPRNAVYLSNRAFANLRLENLGSALADASAAIELDPTYAKVTLEGGGVFEVHTIIIPLPCCGPSGTMIDEVEKIESIRITSFCPTPHPISFRRPTTGEGMQRLPWLTSRMLCVISKQLPDWHPVIQTSVGRYIGLGAVCVTDKRAGASLQPLRSAAGGPGSLPPSLVPMCAQLAEAEKQLKRARFEEALSQPDNDVPVSDTIVLDDIAIDSSYSGPTLPSMWSSGF